MLWLPLLSFNFHRTVFQCSNSTRAILIFIFQIIINCIALCGYHLLRFTYTSMIFFDHYYFLHLTFSFLVQFPSKSSFIEGLSLVNAQVLFFWNVLILLPFRINGYFHSEPCSTIPFSSSFSSYSWKVCFSLLAVSMMYLESERKLTIGSLSHLALKKLWLMPNSLLYRSHCYLIPLKPRWIKSDLTPRVLGNFINSPSQFQLYLLLPTPPPSLTVRELNIFRSKSSEQFRCSLSIDH